MKPILLFSFALALLACSGNENDFDATGTFESTEIIVSSEANGKIMELNLQEGDRLEAGAVLGYVDSTQLYLRKKQLEAGLRSVGHPETGYPQTDCFPRTADCRRPERTAAYGEPGKSKSRQPETGR